MQKAGSRFLISMVLAAGVLAGSAAAATIEVQGVAASNPGKTPAVPAELARFKDLLKSSIFGDFSNAGSQSLSIAAGSKGSASIGSYGIEVGVKSSAGGKCSFDVTIKDAGRPIGKPAAYNNVAAGAAVSIEVGDKKAPTILIFTLRSAD